jgi:DNA-binding NarL/FixJ family response regulator
MKKKILIAEDELLHRRFLVNEINNLRSEVYDIVGEASNGIELIDLNKLLKPDIIIADLQMPKLTGYEAIERIREKDNKVKILVLTCVEETTSIRDLYYLVDGYLIKSKETPLELIKSIDMLVKFDTKVFRDYLFDIIFAKDERKELTTKEIQLLYHLKQDFKNKQLAEKLFLSEKTVEKQLKNLYKKLNVKDRCELLSKIKNLNL